MGDSLFGVVGKDCVVLAADSHIDAHGIINMVLRADPAPRALFQTAHELLIEIPNGLQL